MIFGFNTDVRVQGTVYHVQTEVCGLERWLESQVFVSGRCIGKRSSELPEEATEETAQELARAQHRWLVDAVREGFLEDVLIHEATEELTLQFLGSQRTSDEDVVLRFRVQFGGHNVESAQVSAVWKTDSSWGVLENSLTDDSGVVEMRLSHAGGQVELELRAHMEGREAIRRFLVKSARG
jgi:hypothetical protein